jgi:iron complex transport system permease protein
MNPVASAPLKSSVAGRQDRRRRTLATGWKFTAACGFLVSALVVSAALAVTIGPADIAFSDVFTSALSVVGTGATPLSPIEQSILWDLRMPRVLTAAAVGAGLALSGAVMQAVVRNPLADPYLLGLSSGASVGAVVSLVLGVQLLLPATAFIGSMLALLTTVLLARLSGGLTPTRTILAGVAVSALAGALTSLLIFWHATGDSYRDILSWLMGSLSGAEWSSAATALVALAVFGIPLVASAGILNGFAFGDSAALSLGINVTAVRWSLLCATALLTGFLVSVSGAIGFIGLVLPHAVRLVTGPNHRALLPMSAIVGAIFLIWADTVARTTFDPRELPVGIVTAIIGAPAFAFILARRGGV